MRRTIWAAIAAVIAVPAAYAQMDTGEFTVGDIRIEGLQRISEGTVFNYLPVNIGDRIDQRRVEESLRALYATGFFRDVELRRDGGTLIIAVAERPSIESFTITGNKDIKTEDLEKSLRNVGLARGKTFNQSTLDEGRAVPDGPVLLARQVRRCGLTRESRSLPGNRVKIAIDIAEGKRAKIRRSTSSATEAYDDETLLEQFKLRRRTGSRGTGRTTAIRARSSRATSRSCARTTWTAATRTSTSSRRRSPIAPGKDDIFITLNVKEGQVYRISDIKIAGNLGRTGIRPQCTDPGASRRHLFAQADHATTELMSLRLGADGYAFAKIDPVPQENAETKEIGLTFLIDPGNRAYVRHIAFHGHDEHQRRRAAPRDAADGRRLSLERSGRALEAAPAATAVHREGRGRNQPRFPARRTWST
jgi:outer membrane protein insertion porin family